MANDDVDLGRRRVLTAASTVVGGIGVAYAVTPFVASMNPSARAQAAGAPVEVDISKLEPGQRLTVEWRGKPVWLIRRTEEMLQRLEEVDPAKLRDPESQVASQQPSYAQNPYRSRRPELLVLIGICTHLGCSPSYRPEPGTLSEGWPGGFFCPCHGSRFDMAGRVFSGVPAPTNLVVPPYQFLSDTRLLVGSDTQTA